MTTWAIRFLTSGESHGQALNAIIDGIPYGYELDFNFINSELSLRQKGYGRGARMNIEDDKIKIKSGVRFNITTASPICLEIENKDWKNWRYPMSVEKINFNQLDDSTRNEVIEQIEAKKITKFRPAHADLAGSVKYGFDDIRFVLERSSARETTRVALGAIAQCILKKYNIEFLSEVLSIGKCSDPSKFEQYIDEYKKEGDSLGGIIKITIKNPPIGLGSFVQWDKRLDGRLCGALMSIPAIKSVEVGLGKDYSKASGYNSHDEITYEDNSYKHKTNNSGGIEGGMSNGEDIVLTIAMKPIPTIRKALNSIEMKTHKPYEAHFERSDTSAVEACGIVARNMSAIIILDAFLEKFGGDCRRDIDNSFNQYKKRIDEI